MHCSLGEDQPCCSSTASPDEKKHSMVLRVYRREVERDREGKEVEAGHGHMKRGVKGMQRENKQVREERARE